MRKIFKYNYIPEKRRVNMPENAIILRADHVSDSQYNCDSVWAIVDPQDPVIDRVLEIPFPYSLKEEPQGLSVLEEIQLAVKEKQTIFCHRPLFARERDGKLFVYCDFHGGCRDYEIVFYKTGQKIDVPVENLRYIGLCRLWIIQELGLYTFVNEKALQ